MLRVTHEMVAQVVRAIAIAGVGEAERLLPDSTVGERIYLQTLALGTAQGQCLSAAFLTLAEALDAGN